MKRGIYTSEFWVMIFGICISTILFQTHKLNAEQWINIVTILLGVYTASRGLSKIGGNQNANTKEGRIEE